MTGLIYEDYEPRDGLRLFRSEPFTVDGIRYKPHEGPGPMFDFYRDHVPASYRGSRVRCDMPPPEPLVDEWVRTGKDFLLEVRD